MLNQTKATRTAIEFLTLWMEQDRPAAAAHIAKVTNDPDEPEAAYLAVAGQLNLSMVLLYMLAKEQGATTNAEFQSKANEILREFSLGLPE